MNFVDFTMTYQTIKFHSFLMKIKKVVIDLIICFVVVFLVDGSTAGLCNLEISVNGGHVTSHVRELGDQCFLASFVPHQAPVHTIEVFNSLFIKC